MPILQITNEDEARQIKRRVDATERDSPSERALARCARRAQPDVTSADTHRPVKTYAPAAR